jgi:hypothetical protein
MGNSETRSNLMSIIDDLISGWKRRINILQQENRLMESGKMRTGETKIVDGRILQRNSTEESIQTKKKWISQIEKVIVYCKSDK